MVRAAAYAQHRGVSLQAVSAAIRDGRLVESAHRMASGRYRIDPVLADAEWAANTDGGAGYTAHAENSLPALLDSTDLGENITYAEARAKHERLKSRLAELEVATIEGKLVNADEVKRESFRAARQVRDSLLNLPDRLAAELAAETSQLKVHQRLVKEIRRALEELKLE